MAQDTRGPGNGLLYGLVGALSVVVIGGGYYIYQYQEALSPVPPTPAPAMAPIQAAPAPPAPPASPAPAGPTAGQLAQARDVIANAQRLARRGDFSGAEAALQQADRVVPGFAETAAARREIADLRTARGNDRRDRDRGGDAKRIASLVETARGAIARRDYGAADRALDEAERIDARDPTVVRARNDLLEASRPDRRDDRRDGRN